MCEPEAKGAAADTGGTGQEAAAELATTAAERQWDANLLKAKLSEIKQQLSDTAAANKEPMASDEATASRDLPSHTHEATAGISDTAASSDAVKTELHEGHLTDPATVLEPEDEAQEVHNEQPTGETRRLEEAPELRNPRLQLRLLTQRNWLFASRHIPKSVLHRASIINANPDLSLPALEKQLSRAEHRPDRATSEYQVLHTAVKLRTRQRGDFHWQRVVPLASSPAHLYQHNGEDRPEQAATGTTAEHVDNSSAVAAASRATQPEGGPGAQEAPPGALAEPDEEPLVEQEPERTLLTSI